MTSRAFGRRDVSASAGFAAEYSALQEADVGLALGARVDELERRIATLERLPLSRVRATLSGRSLVKAAWASLLAFVPTRRAALVLFVLALAVFAFEALGWPMAKGRDTWDYLAYYLQLTDRHPPLSDLQVFRTPLTPIVLGVPLSLGGTTLLEVVFAALYAAAIVGLERDRA